jgi:hypothetical protein
VPSEGNDYVELATQQQNPNFANSGATGKSNMGVIGDSGLIVPSPKKKELNFELGVTYSYPFATQYHNLWEIWKTDKVTILQLEVMRRTDGHARSLYRALTLPIVSALKTSYVMPVDGMEGGQDEANFIELMLNLPPASGGMVVTLNKFIRQMLLGVFHGFSAFEMVYWVPSRGPLAGKITLKKASWRPADTVHFLTNPQNEFAGWRQRTFVNGRYIDVLLPHETALVYTCNSEESPFYGVSMFESAFWHYDKKVKLYYLAHLAAQKGAIGTRIGHMPPNPNKADKEHFLQQLNQLGVKQFMAMPLDWDVNVIQETGKFDYISLIEHHNHMMSESVLAGFMDGNATGGNSPQVDFSTQDDTLFIQMLETVMDDLADVINNQLIPRFIDWNFGTGKYPTFHWGPFTDEQKDAIRLTVNQMALAPTINMAPELWQALQVKWAKDLGINVDFDSIQGQWDQQNEQNDQLSQLTFQTNLVEQHNSLLEAANPPPPVAPPVPGAPAAPAVAAKPAGPNAASTTQARPAAKKVPATKKIAAAQKTAATGAPAARKAQTAAKQNTGAAKQNSGNPNPTQGAKQLSPKSQAQKNEDKAKERQRGH